MIVANIKDAKRYFGVNPNFEKAFEYLKTLNKDSQAGPFEFDDFRGNVALFEDCDDDVDDKEVMLEAHKDYIDIHFVINGSETVGYADVENLEIVKEYIKEQDFLLLKGDMQKVNLSEGDFCIVFPEDAHAPAMHARGNLKKAIVKIEV